MLGYSIDLALFYSRWTNLTGFDDHKGMKMLNKYSYKSTDWLYSTIVEFQL